MRKILKIIILSLLFANATHAETKIEKRAKFVLLNMQQDYIACYSFYKIGAEYVRKSNGDTVVINGIEKSSDTSLKLVHETGEIMGMLGLLFDITLRQIINKTIPWRGKG